MFSGGLILHGVFKMAVKLSSPVYYYIYDHMNNVSFNSFYGPYPFPKKLGVTHADYHKSILKSRIGRLKRRGSQCFNSHG